MAPGTTAQLHLAIKPWPRRRGIGAGQRGFVQRLLRRHGCKTRWGAGPGLVWRNQRRLPLQVNLSFEMRCARVWLAQLAAELCWSPQFIERRQQHAHFRQFAATVMSLRQQSSTLTHRHPTVAELRRELLLLPGAGLPLTSELRLTTDRIRETVFPPDTAGRFEASARRHQSGEFQRVSPRRKGVASSPKPDFVHGKQEWRLSPVNLLPRTFTAGIADRVSHTAYSRSNNLLVISRYGRSQTRFERMQSHYLAELALPNTVMTADGRASSEMWLRRPERTWAQSHPHAFAPEMTLHRPQRHEDGQRQIAAALPEMITAVKAAGSAAVSNKPVAFAEPDLSQLTDRVYAELERKMRNERIRRGL
ncbi:hypothetical protein KJ068_20630 [bacterium]|nr:hypothetical protein [bacterium]